MFGFNPSNRKQLNNVIAGLFEKNMLSDIDVNEAIIATVETHLNIETYTDGTAQVETATAAGTVTANPGGDATVTVTAKNMTSSPKTISVPLLLNDDANAIAEKIRAALTSDADVSAFFTVGGATDKIILTAKTPAENDYTMNIAIAAGTATGVTAAATSATTTKGTKNEIVNPSILFFPNGWNGYKYWLGYTPYDNGDSQYENPCIAVSNDNNIWTVPTGLINPIEPKPASGFNADVNLFMSPDEKTMYMLFKYQGTTKTIYLRSSNDGVNWTPKVVLIEESYECLSPSVVWDGLQYKMWYVKNDDTPNNIYVRTSPSALGPWSEPVLCVYNGLPSGKEPWHLEVRKVGNQYHMILTGTFAPFNEIFFGKSNDGINWNFGYNSLFRNRGSIHSNYNFYKCSMLPMQTDEGLKYGVWYGSSEPYYVCYSEISFDRTKLINKCNDNVVCASYGLSPWIFCDTFNRIDTVAGLGTSDSGHIWAKVIGDEMGISSNKAYLPSPGTYSRNVVDLGISDFYIEATFPAVNMGESSKLLFRYIDTSNYWRIGPSGQIVEIIKTKAGKHSYYFSSVRMMSGDRLGIECNGDIIKMYINGLLRQEITDADNNTGTKIGLAPDNAGITFDNLIARTIY